MAKDILQNPHTHFLGYVYDWSVYKKRDDDTYLVYNDNKDVLYSVYDPRDILDIVEERCFPSPYSPLS